LPCRQIRHVPPPAGTLSPSTHHTPPSLCTTCPLHRSARLATGRRRYDMADEYYCHGTKPSQLPNSRHPSLTHRALSCFHTTCFLPTLTPFANHQNNLPQAIDATAYQNNKFHNMMVRQVTFSIPFWCSSNLIQIGCITSKLSCFLISI